MFEHGIWFWVPAMGGLLVCSGIRVPAFEVRAGNLAAPWILAVIVTWRTSAGEIAMLAPVSCVIVYLMWRVGLGSYSVGWLRRTSASVVLVQISWVLVSLLRLQPQEGGGVDTTVTLASVAGIWAFSDIIFRSHGQSGLGPLNGSGRRFPVLDAVMSFFAAISFGSFAVFLSEIGLWAGLVSLIPFVVISRLILSLLVVRRVERLALRAIGRLPEAAGLVESDHVMAVERLAIALGVSLGLRHSEVDELARAAMLHEVGLVTCSGGDRLKAGYSKRDVAAWGESLLAQSPVLGPVARIVGDQAEPFKFPGADPDPALDVRSQIIHVSCEIDNLRRAGMAESQIVDEVAAQVTFRFSPRVVAEVPCALALMADHARGADSV